MKRWCASLTLALALFAVSGCWDNNELDEYGYVQAVAIDSSEDDLIRLTTHFYNPSNKTEMSGSAKSSTAKGINIVTSAETIFEAVRDVPLKFGRKAKWDHMRVILIGEKLAQSRNIREILDYFSRDHEPRGTVLPLIAEGEAADFLNIRPFIEQTIGQQFKKMETNGAIYTGKTTKIPLYELAIQMKSPSKTSDIPLIRITDSGKEAVVSGIAILKDSKLVDALRGKDTEAYLMLVDKYESGVLEFPCIGNAEGMDRRMESIEVIFFRSRLIPHVRGDSVSVDVRIEIKGTIGELKCSRLKSVEDAELFEQKIAEQVQLRLHHAISIFERRKADLVGIGNRIYRKNPKQWKRLEPSWDEIISRCRFDIHVDVEVLSTGLNVGTPFGYKEK